MASVPQPWLRPALRSIPLLPAVSLHPLLAAGVKRNSVPWAPKSNQSGLRARAKIPLTLLPVDHNIRECLVSVRFPMGPALWCRCRERMSHRLNAPVWPLIEITSAASTRHRWDYPLPRRLTLLGVSESHFYCLHRTGRLGPLPVRMGRAVRWSRKELVDWFEAESIPGAVGLRCGRRTIRSNTTTARRQEIVLPVTNWRFGALSNSKYRGNMRGWQHGPRR